MQSRQLNSVFCRRRSRRQLQVWVPLVWFYGSNYFVPEVGDQNRNCRLELSLQWWRVTDLLRCWNQPDFCLWYHDLQSNRCNKPNRNHWQNLLEGKSVSRRETNSRCVHTINSSHYPSPHPSHCWRGYLPSPGHPQCSQLGSTVGQGRASVLL